MKTQYFINKHDVFFECDCTIDHAQLQDVRQFLNPESMYYELFTLNECDCTQDYIYISVDGLEYHQGKRIYLNNCDSIEQFISTIKQEDL